MNALQAIGSLKKNPQLKVTSHQAELFRTMSDKLHQINVQYINKEDRILLRTSTENNDEFLIWLTRRYTKLLMDVLDEEINKRGGTTILGSKKETKDLYSEGAFETAYSEQHAKKHPLGGVGLLAFGIKTSNDRAGNLILEIQSETGKGITLNLNDTFIYMFYSLLIQGIEHAEWQIVQFNNMSKQQIH